jgi:hypothetical protein
MSGKDVPGRDSVWTKASRSAASGQCVEMRRQAGLVEVRDSKDPEGPMLRFTRAEFLAWVDGAANGEFRHLAAD